MCSSDGKDSGVERIDPVERTESDESHKPSKRKIAQIEPEQKNSQGDPPLEKTKVPKLDVEAIANKVENEALEAIERVKNEASEHAVEKVDNGASESFDENVKIGTLEAVVEKAESVISEPAVEKEENDFSDFTNEKSEDGALNAKVEKAKNGAAELEASSTPECPKFTFGQTFNDPKYSWLNSIGKKSLGTGANPTLKANGAAPLFQGFQTSPSTSNLSDKATPDVNFDELLSQAKVVPQPPAVPSIPVIPLNDDPMTTGEEDEDTCFEAVGKLYILGEGNKWIERGAGQLRINCLRGNSASRRIIMRLESVYKVILNVKVIPSLKPTTEGKFVRFLAFENEASPSTFTFRTSSADVARSLVEEMLSAN